MQDTIGLLMARRRVATACVALLVGCLIYLLARPAGLWLVPDWAGAGTNVPHWLLILLGPLPSFLHVVALSLLTLAILDRPGSVLRGPVIGAWVAVDLTFEFAQAGIWPGTFAAADVLAALAGGGVAWWLDRRFAGAGTMPRRRRVSLLAPLVVLGVVGAGGSSLFDNDDDDDDPPTEDDPLVILTATPLELDGRPGDTVTFVTDLDVLLSEGPNTKTLTAELPAVLEGNVTVARTDTQAEDRLLVTSWAFTIGNAAPAGEYRITFRATVTDDSTGVSDSDSQRVDLNVARLAQPSAAPVAISASSRASFALLHDGTVLVFGANDNQLIDDGGMDQFNAVPKVGLGGAVAIEAGTGHMLALLGDGTVMAWGDNRTGALGDGTTTSRTEPAPVSGLNGVVQISAGGNFSLALLSDGTVMAWGTDELGQLGDGEAGDPATVPQPVPGLSDVQALAAGNLSALALRNDGTVWAWGSGFRGTLGDGSTVDHFSATPIQVPGLADVVDIGATLIASYALLADGTVMAWGGDQQGELGDGEPRADRGSPGPVDDLNNVRALLRSGHGQHMLALGDSGELLAWGNGVNGQIGIGSEVDAPVPAQVPGLPPLDGLAAGAQHSLGLQLSEDCGAVWAWGLNQAGRLGLGDPGIERALTPRLVSGIGESDCRLLALSIVGGGRVTSDIGDIDCGQGCARFFAPDASVTLTVAPGPGERFLSWGGDCANPDGSPDTTHPLTLVMDGHRHCSAEFESGEAASPPTAAFAFMPESPVEVGTEVAFDAAASSDSDGSITLYEWDFEDDGTFDSNGITTSFTYASPGTYAPRLRVTDDDALSDDVTQEVVVQSAPGNLAPMASFSFTPPSPVATGTQVSFEAGASSDPDGIINQYQWDFTDDGSFDATGVNAAFTYATAGSFVARLRVTDDDGLSDEATANIAVQDPGPSPTFFTLTVVFAGGPGTVNVDPPNVNLPGVAYCSGSVCTVTDLAEGEDYTLTATSGFFAFWGNGDCDMEVATQGFPECVVTLNSDRTVDVVFE